MLNFDSSQRPVRPAEWAAVLDAVYMAEPADEQTWIEWKSTLDLRSKEHMATEVAKAIIALANRDPIESSAHVGGIGILIIGIEPGAVVGVKQVDNADLDQMLTRYLGPDGPVWQPHWDQYRGKTILIIEVAAPTWGDPPHAFRKEFSGPRDGAVIRDGAVFVRHLARSVSADHRDVRRLADRYANRPNDNTLDIVVRVDSDTQLSRYTWTEDSLGTFIASERERLMKSFRKATRPRNLDHFSFASAIYAEIEKRSPEEYESEVESYLKEVRLSWPEAMRSVAGYLLAPTIFTITNLSERNYRQLEVSLHVAGEADAVERNDDPSELGLWRFLPAEPRKWGQQEYDHLRGLVTLPRAADFRSVGPIGPTTRLDRGGSFTLTPRPLDLRPTRTQVLEDGYVILIPTSRTGELTVSWSATATNVDATAQGQFSLSLDGPDVDLFDEYIRRWSDHVF